MADLSASDRKKSEAGAWVSSNELRILVLDVFDLGPWV